MVFLYRFLSLIVDDTPLQQAAVSLNIVPPPEIQSEALTPSGIDSPQITYTMPAARRPGASFP